MLRLCYAHKARKQPTDDRILASSLVSGSWLREIVQHLSVPRHFLAQPETNRATADWIQAQLQSWGYETQVQGEHHNLLTVPAVANRPLVLVGAHYDTKPGTPGADDNASAVTALLACACAVAEHAATAPVMFVAFNREEEDLTGSRDFVANHLSQSGLQLRETHILEMVGYRDRAPGSQRIPGGLPIKVRDVGDFLGILANRNSLKLADRLLACAHGYLPELPVIALKIYCGLEKRFRDLLRSDHAPFWAAGKPALMWTDTAEFRNPHYHQPSDLPDTLDYEFLGQVTQLLIAHVLTASQH